MKKSGKIILKTFLILAAVTAAAGIYVRREMGAVPSKEETASYEKLSYFKNGTFQSPQPLVYDFKNVRNGNGGGFARFLVRSRFAPQKPLPKIMPDKNSFAGQPSDFAVYWLGHSAALMELNGRRIIFDPVLGNAAPIPFAVPRYGNAPVSRKDLPDADYIVISHNHYDHLERKTIQAIKKGHFIVPLGVGAALRGWGVDKDRITELGWRDIFEKDGLKIIAAEGVHYSGRSPFDRNKTLWNSYILQSGNKNIFWAGDTGYGKHFADLGKEFGPFDFFAVEIDGWNTGWPNTHLFPAEVIRAAQDLNVKTILPLHWAVFDLALHPWHESIDMVVEQAEGTGIKILTPKIGEKITPDSKTSHWWKE